MAEKDKVRKFTMDKKNTIIGVLLLCAAFYFMFTAAPLEKARTAQTTESTVQKTEQANKKAEENKIESAPSLYSQEKGAKEEFVTLENKNIRVHLTNKGGAIAKVDLLKYIKEQGSTENYAFNGVEVLDKNMKLPALSLAFSNASSAIPEPLLRSFKFDEKSSSNVAKVYKLVLDGKFEITRRYALAKEGNQDCAPYIIISQTSIKNISDKDLSLNEVFLNLGTVEPTASDVYGTNLASVFFDTDGESYYARSSAFVNSSGFLGIGASVAADFENTTVAPETSVKWAAIKNQFFASVFTPMKDASPSSMGGVTIPIKTALGGGDKYMSNAISTFMGFNTKTLSPNESIKIDGNYYVGPKELDKLYSIGGGQEEIMNYGWFGFVSRPLSRLMNWIHSWFPSDSPDSWAWGWSIIILTLIVRGLMWPLTSMQIKSAQRMAKMQEPIKAIREKYKGDNKRIQQETMKIYSEYGINPLAGCLPILIQIPIFIGLYYMLQTSCEIRFAHFLWIDDLSLPDTIEALPSVFGIPLHILPILNAVVTFIQMHLTPTPSADKSQTMMFKFMPIIMLVFFYTFPSGLVLYWLVQSLLGILQAIIIRRGKDKVVLKKREKSGFWQRMQDAMENAQKLQAARGEEYQKLPLREKLRIAREDAIKARKAQQNDALKGTMYEKRKKNPGGRSTRPKR